MSKIIGIEVSEAHGDIDWSLTRQHVSFVYIKASQGVETVDAALEENWREAGEVGLPRGLVHIFHPKDIKDWKKQLELFTGLVGKFPCELTPALDIQTNNGLRKVEMDNIGAKFCKRFSERTGQELILRTNAAFFNKRLPLTDWAKPRGLWVVDIRGDEPAVPVEWSKRKPPWIFWKYSAGENSLGAAYGLSSTSADLTRFFGDATRFNKIFGVMVAPVEPVKAGEQRESGRAAPLAFRSRVDHVIVRGGPGDQFPRVGELQSGERGFVEDFSAPQELWVRIGEDRWVPWILDGKQMLDKEDQ